MAFENPIQYWNQLNRHWLRAKHICPITMIRYESLLEFPRLTLARLEIKPKKEFVIHKRKINIGADGHPNSETSVEFNGEYYLQRQYLSEYTPDLERYVANRLDKNLLREWNYA